jgi:hypothetical protein
VSLVVEDGTIVAGANSWLSVAAALALAVNHEYELVWTALTTPNQEKHLIRGARYICLKYHSRWDGQRVSRDQALDHPRFGLCIDGYGINSNVIHTYVKQAQFEAAVRSASGEILIPDLDPDTNAGALSYERFRVGPIEEQLRFDGAKSRVTKYPMIDYLLTDFLVDGGSYPMERG